MRRAMLAALAAAAVLPAWNVNILAPEGQNYFMVADEESGDGHVPRGERVVKLRMCEPEMPPRLRCGPMVRGPRGQG